MEKINQDPLIFIADNRDNIYVEFNQSQGQNDDKSTAIFL